MAKAKAKAKAKATKEMIDEWKQVKPALVKALKKAGVAVYKSRMTGSIGCYERGTDGNLRPTISPALRKAIFALLPTQGFVEQEVKNVTANDATLTFYTYKPAEGTYLLEVVNGRGVSINIKMYL